MEIGWAEAVTFESPFKGPVLFKAALVRPYKGLRRPYKALQGLILITYKAL